MAEATNSKPSFLHMIQSFLIDIVQQLRPALPPGAELLRSGRTIANGVMNGKSFRVRVTMSQFDDDMWPHVDAIVTIGDGMQAPETTFDFHPDLTAQGHAEKIVEAIQSLTA